MELADTGNQGSIVKKTLLAGHAEAEIEACGWREDPRESAIKVPLGPALILWCCRKQMVFPDNGSSRVICRRGDSKLANITHAASLSMGVLIGGIIAGGGRVRQREIVVGPSAHCGEPARFPARGPKLELRVECEMWHR